MAETTNQQSQSGDQTQGQQGQQGQQNQGQNNDQGGGVATRPDYLPEKFWDAAKGTPNLENLGRSYNELQTRFSAGKEAYKTEYETDRLKNRPAAVDGYKVELPKEGAPKDLVILDSKPADTSKLEAGKKYFVADKNDPLYKWWAQTCFDNGVGQEGFMKGIMQFAGRQVGDVTQSVEATKAHRTAEVAKLGENGPKRIDHAWKQLQAVIGEPGAKALDDVLGSAAAVEALEKLLEKAGAPKFIAGSGAQQGSATAEAAKAKIAQLEADKEFQKKILDKGHPQHQAAMNELSGLHRQARAA